MNARIAHPKGPESRPFVTRSIKLIGTTQECELIFSCPVPDDGFDNTSDGCYSVSSSFQTALALRYIYKGFFWQGVFGTVGIDVIINRREPSDHPWVNLDTLLEGIRNQAKLKNEISTNIPYGSREAWLEPHLAKLNGIPCLQQYVKWGDDPQGVVLYYFLLDSNSSVEIQVRMIDNSKRPGLPESDWRQRAEIFAKRIMDTMQVHCGPIPSELP